MEVDHISNGIYTILGQLSTSIVCDNGDYLHILLGYVSNHLGFMNLDFLKQSELAYPSFFLRFQTSVHQPRPNRSSEPTIHQ